MPVTIADNKNTTIIRLHGGPGASPYYLHSESEKLMIKNGINQDMSKRIEHIKAMYKEFNLVFWQQRGGFYATGNSIKDITLHQMASDLDALVYFIRKKYGDSHNIILSGHSFGGTLSYYYLSHFENSHNIAAAIIEASPIDFVKKLELAFNRLISILKSRSDYNWDEVISRLNEIKIELYGESPNVFKSKIETLSDKRILLEYIMFDNLNIIDYNSPEETLKKLSPDFLKTTQIYNEKLINNQEDRGMSTLFFTIIPQILKNNFNDKLVNIKVPVLLQYGRNDLISPHQEADTICSKISNCKINPSVFLKKYDAGHRIFEENPEALRNDRINFIHTILSK